ncbi:MAG: hypothetical protein HQL03_09525 [Nitrospirae bacterium]|nr:hypothetical protein [Nitrospirota bacterium]MBF0592603.1 hypothetical protein [Nitrospirota bacterium]
MSERECSRRCKLGIVLCVGVVAFIWLMGNAVADERRLQEWTKSEQPDYLSSPRSIVVDGSGNIYIASAFDNRILRFNSKGKFIAKWGGEGRGEGHFEIPSAIAADSRGNIYIADTGNNRIQKFTADGKFITKWVISRDDDWHMEGFPCGIAVDGRGNVYVADAETHRLQKFSSKGKFIATWGDYNSGEDYNDDSSDCDDDNDGDNGDCDDDDRDD